MGEDAFHYGGGGGNSYCIISLTLTGEWGVGGVLDLEE